MILEKTLADITVSGMSLTVSLSQADTLLFHDGPVQIQMRGKLAGGRALASNMAYKRLEDIIDVIRESVDVIEVLKPVYNFKAN